MNAAGKIMKYKMREAAVEKLGLQKASRIETAQAGRNPRPGEGDNLPHAKQYIAGFPPKST